MSAKDLATQKEQSIKITASSGLSKDEVEKLLRDAQSHTEDDKKRRKLAEAKNQGDNLVYQTEKNITEYGDKVSADEKTKIQDAIATLKKALEGTDAEAIESATQTLMTASHKLAEEMYKKAAASSGPQPGASATGGTSETKPDEKVGGGAGGADHGAERRLHHRQRFFDRRRRDGQLFLWAGGRKVTGRRTPV